MPTARIAPSCIGLNIETEATKLWAYDVKKKKVLEIPTKELEFATAPYVNFQAAITRKELIERQ